MIWIYKNKMRGILSARTIIYILSQKLDPQINLKKSWVMEEETNSAAEECSTTWLQKSQSHYPAQLCLEIKLNLEIQFFFMFKVMFSPKH